APPGPTCRLSGASTSLDSPPPNSRACGDQATCLDAELDAQQCSYHAVSGKLWLYCAVCLTWPRAGSNCALAQAPPPPPPARRGSTIAPTASAGVDTVCSGDKLSTVLEGAGGAPVPGGINQVSSWSPGNATQYCQWVRWDAADYAPQPVLFSVRSGTKACSTLDMATMVSVKGVQAVCSGPRFGGSGVAGCSSNDGSVYNECLWTLYVPRPGGRGWDDAEACIPPFVAPPPPGSGTGDSRITPPPPRRSANPGGRAPRFPPAPFAPPSDACLLAGPSTESAGGGNTACADQASCLDFSFSSADCEYRTDPLGGTSACAVSSAIDYVCAGDELSSVLDTATGQPVPGGIYPQAVFPWGHEEELVLAQRHGAPRAPTASGSAGVPMTSVYWSMKTGGTRCTRHSNVTVTLRGATATCSAPRTNDFKGFAGGKGNDALTHLPNLPSPTSQPTPDVDNECLWSLDVPRPGGPGWTGGEVCVDPLPPPSAAGASPSPPPPPRRRVPGAVAGRSVPPWPPSPPPPPPPSVPPPPKRAATPGKRMPNPPPPNLVTTMNKIPFPFCACKQRSVKNTPYRLVYQNSTNLQTLSDGKARIRHCFTIDTPSCDARSPCCDMGIKKIEFLTENVCRSSVRLALVGGQSQTWTFTTNEWKGDTYTTFKLPTINMPRPTVPDGLPVCVVLTEPCASLDDFCWGADGTCRTTFYSIDEECCPTGDVPTTMPDSVMVEIVGAPPVSEFDF
ncbi:hypothetical protein TSOC_011753, partial [Tetrabaena socialis]